MSNIIGKMIVHVIKDNMSDGAVLSSVQFAHNADEWSYNFSLQNSFDNGVWERDNDSMFNAIEEGVSDLKIDEDANTYLTFTEMLSTGAVIQQSGKLELESGEVRITDSAAQDEMEVSAEEILDKMREIFGFKFEPEEDKPTNPKSNKEPGSCKCGCCCKKKRI